MKKIAALVLAALAVSCTFAQTSVGVSIGIHQPGVYGRINIGDLPRPALVQSQPVFIAPAPVHVESRPIYLYVPPTHQRDWRRYCGRYSACGQPVYFVKDEWVRDRYQQAHPGWDRGGKKGRGDGGHGEHGHGKDKHKGHGKGHGHGHDD